VASFELPDSSTIDRSRVTEVAFRRTTSVLPDGSARVYARQGQAVLAGEVASSATMSTQSRLLLVQQQHLRDVPGECSFVRRPLGLMMMVFAVSLTQCVPSFHLRCDRGRALVVNLHPSASLT
jgi:hypothetical protein